MNIVVKIGIFFLNVIFALMKLLPVEKKITYISRQMNTIPIDFQMCIDQFKKDYPEYQHVTLCKMIPSGIFHKIGYIGHMFKQMYHIATSEAVILDTYCIPISILKQRKSLIVIQMWHALGSFKKFGYSILDQKEGSSSKIAQLMKMHYHYTYVLTSSIAALPNFAEAFNVDKSKMKVLPLPKTDLLMNKEYADEIKKQINQTYLKLAKTSKKIIVYAPTFRKTDNHLEEATQALISKIDFSTYELVLKLHPLTPSFINDKRVIVDQQFSSLDFFYKADIIITDYSAVLFEACMLQKPIYFFAFDYQQYTQNRSFYINYQKDMPGPIAYDASTLINYINEEICDLNKVEQFKNWMVASPKQTYTKDFTDFLYQELTKGETYGS